MGIERATKDLVIDEVEGAQVGNPEKRKWFSGYAGAEILLRRCGRDGLFEEDEQQYKVISIKYITTGARNILGGFDGIVISFEEFVDNDSPLALSCQKIYAPKTPELTELRELENHQNESGKFK